MFYRETDFQETSLGKIPKDWAVVRLKDVSLDFVGGGTPSTLNPDYWNGEFAWMTSAHIIGATVNSGQKYITKKGLENSATNLIPKNNILVATRVGIGKVTINRIDIAISQDLTGVIINRNEALPEFLYWFLTSNDRRLKSLAQGSTIKGILKEDLSRLCIPHLSLEEQKTIVGVLGVADLAVGKTCEVIAKTERLKKGLMQELLTRGIGHMKFTHSEELGHEIPEEWEAVKLETVSLGFIGGGTPSTSNPDYWNGEIAWMTSAHINGRLITSGQKYITKKGLENSATNLIPKDNLLVATRVGIGKAAINKIDIAISQDLTGVIINKDKAIPEFLYWAIASNEKKLKSLAQGSTIKGILKEDLSRLFIPKPHIPEQQKIAEVLSTVDRKLAVERKVKAKLERVKQSLMDLLLTGKIRVKVN